MKTFLFKKPLPVSHFLIWSRAAICLVVLSLCFSMSVGAQELTTQNGSQNNQKNLSEGKKPTKKYPTVIQPKKEIAASAKSAVFNEFFAMTQHDKMQSVKIEQDNLGFTHEKYQQYYKGVKVEGALYTVHSKKGLVKSLTGYFVGIEGLEVVPAISEQTAFANALSHVGGKGYAWEKGNPLGYTDFKKPEGQLVIYANAFELAPAKLAYKFDIYSAEPLFRAYVFIDAHTGEFIKAHNRILNGNVPATGNSLYDGNVGFTADENAGTYRLRQTSYGDGVETYDMNNGTNYGAATDITSASSNFTGSETGVQAHYGAEQTYDYFFTVHGRNSYNGIGGKLLSYVSYATNYVNAFWDGTRMTYGDGDGINYGPLVSLDIAGHEMAHGVTEFSANLLYQRESGALNESFSDIFGEMVEFHAKGTNDWQLGTEIGIGGSGAIRSMDNPNTFWGHLLAKPQLRYAYPRQRLLWCTYQFRCPKLLVLPPFTGRVGHQ